MLSSAWNCESLRLHAHASVQNLKEIQTVPNSLFTEEKNYYFANEGKSVPVLATSVASRGVTSEYTLEDKDNYEDRHCLFINTNTKVDVSFGEAHSFCRNLRARMCLASEVEAFASGSPQQADLISDKVYYWTQSTSLRAPLESGCDKNEKIVVKFNEAGELETVCRSVSIGIGIARRGLCC